MSVVAHAFVRGQYKTGVKRYYIYLIMRKNTTRTV